MSADTHPSKRAPGPRAPVGTTPAKRVTRVLALVGLVLVAAGLILVLWIAEPGTTLRGLSAAAVALGALWMLIFLAVNAADIRAFFHSRQFRYGGNVAAMVVFAAAIVVFVNLIAAKFYSVADWTRRGTFTLSSETRNLVRSLTDNVTAVVFYRDDAKIARLQDLLRRYRSLSDKVRPKYVDRSDEAEVKLEAARYNVTEWDVVVLEYQGKRKVVHDYDLFTTEGFGYPGMPPPREIFKGEDALTSAIRTLVEEDPPVVMFTTGFGEPTIDQVREPRGFSRIAQEVRDSNMTVESLPMFGRTAIPDTCDVLVVASPDRTYGAAEVQAIRAYLEERRGGVVFLIEPVLEERSPGRPRLADTGFDDLLESFGVKVEKALVTDPERRMLLQGPFVFFSGGRSYNPHPIMDSLEGATTTWTAALPLTEPEGHHGYRVDALVKTSDRAWGETDLRFYFETGRVVFNEDADVKGPLTIAMAVSSDEGGGMMPGRSGTGEPIMLVFGDGTFVSNAEISPQNANRDLFINGLRWLTGRTASMGIPPKEVDEVFFTVTRPQATLVWVGTLGLAVLAVVAGVIVWIVRR